MSKIVFIPIVFAIVIMFLYGLVSARADDELDKIERKRKSTKEGQ